MLARRIRRSPSPARALLLVVASTLAVVSLAQLPTAAPAGAVDVNGEQQRYVGTGGLLLPPSVDHGTRREVAGCGGCRWQLTSPCAEAPGTPFPGQDPCLSVVRGCPAMGELLRAWFAPPGAAWREVGLICLRPGGPVTIRDLGVGVHERFVHDLPRLGISQAPPQGILAQIPVVFDSGQPAGPFTADYTVLGERVSLTGTPTWTWLFGDGAQLRTDDPGGPYPHLAVSHAYRRAGRMAVQVRTDWTATFTVDGLGPYRVEQPVAQDASAQISVGEGRAVLAVR